MRFWDQLKKIIAPLSTEKSLHQHQEKEKKHCKEELLEHEVLERSAEEKNYFGIWEKSNRKGEVLHWLHEQYLSYRDNCKCDPAINFLMIPSVNGFVIHFDPARWPEKDFVCLFDFFADKLLQEGYWTQVSDTKTNQKCGAIETVQRHYLKPPRQLDLNCGEKMDQKFGNLMLSLCIMNGKTCNLKLSATHYNDRNFETAYHFDSLMKLLCE